MIIRNRNELRQHYHELGPGDVLIGSVTEKFFSQKILIDLMERGVLCYPSPLSQILCGSKTSQAMILGKWMIPGTMAISRRIELMEAINLYNSRGIGTVISKEDRLHCGHGIRKWDNIETLYNFMGLNGESSFPFVLQPFLENAIDVRVIMAGDYVEAYSRENANNFRMNLASGGVSCVFELDNRHIRFCREVMERGRFCYAHIDLLLDGGENIYLSEISLNAGTKGAAIKQKKLSEIKRDVLEKHAGRNA